MKYLLIILVFFSACIPPKEVRRHRRAMRKVEKARYISPSSFSLDTIIIHDTIVINKVEHDTTTKIIYHDSTIIVNNERVFAKYYYDTIRETIRFQMECKTDTIIKKIPIEVPILVDPTVGNLIDRVPSWLFISFFATILILLSLRIWRPPK